MNASSDPGAATPAPNSNATQVLAGGVMRRLGAIVYDTLVSIAVLMFATLPFLPLAGDKVLQPAEVGALAYVYQTWELVVLAVFFGFFWTRRGQTVGMQAWRLRVEDEHGQLLKWPSALRRFAYSALPWVLSAVTFSFAAPHRWTLVSILSSAFALLGILNVLSPWFDRDRRSWHDKLSHSRVVAVSKRKG